MLGYVKVLVRILTASEYGSPDDIESHQNIEMHQDKEQCQNMVQCTLSRVGKIFFDPNIQLFPDTYGNFIEKKFCPSSHRPNPSPGDQSQ